MVAACFTSSRVLGGEATRRLGSLGHGGISRSTCNWVQCSHGIDWNGPLDRGVASGSLGVHSADSYALSWFGKHLVLSKGALHGTGPELLSAQL